MLVPPAIVISVPTLRVAKKLASKLSFSRRLHTGLFSLWEGYRDGVLVAVVYCQGDEDVHYACVRHLAHLYRVACVTLVEPVVAVSEDLALGDVIIVREARHYFCPTALPGNLDAPNELLFRGEQVQEWLGAPPVLASPKFLDAWSRIKAPDLRKGISTVAKFCNIGSSSRPIRGWRAPEFVRSHFSVEVVDEGAYGFLCACKDVGLTGGIVGVVEAAVTHQLGMTTDSGTMSRKLQEAALAALDVAYGEFASISFRRILPETCSP
jgi:hypothetical protein